jgi:hypothetical protein
VHLVIVLVHLAFYFCCLSIKVQAENFCFLAPNESVAPQGHLISSQLFVFWLFLFLLVKQTVVCKEDVRKRTRFKKS